MNDRPIRIILVEDDLELRELTYSALKAEEGMSIVGSFGDAETFLEQYPTLEADVVLMDIGLPGMSGIDCVAQAKPMRPAAQFLVCTVFENPAYTFRALCAGATGYLLKNTRPQEMAAAIRDLQQGGSPMSPAIARMVVDSFQGEVKERIHDDALTERERNVLDQLAQGLMYKEIAANAGISVETVRKHARNIYGKLHVNSRMEAIRKVYPNGG